MSTKQHPDIGYVAVPRSVHPCHPSTFFRVVSSQSLDHMLVHLPSHVGPSTEGCINHNINVSTFNVQFPISLSIWYITQLNNIPRLQTFILVAITQRDVTGSTA